MITTYKTFAAFTLACAILSEAHIDKQEDVDNLQIHILSPINSALYNKIKGAR